MARAEAGRIARRGGQSIWTFYALAAVGGAEPPSLNPVTCRRFGPARSGISAGRNPRLSPKQPQPPTGSHRRPLVSGQFHRQGLGHGVGMSQWGANARSQTGHSPRRSWASTTRTPNLWRTTAMPVGANPLPTPTPTPTTSSTATQFPTSAQDPAQILLATTDTTTLTPQGSTASPSTTRTSLSEARTQPGPAGTPIAIARAGGLWRITYGTTDLAAPDVLGRVPNSTSPPTPQWPYPLQPLLLPRTHKPHRGGRRPKPIPHHRRLADRREVSKRSHNDSGVPAPVSDTAEEWIQVLLANAEVTTLTPRAQPDHH